MRRLIFNILSKFLFLAICFNFSLFQIQAQDGDINKLPEEKADFPIDVSPSPKPQGKAKILSDSYIFIIKDEVVPSFTSKFANKIPQFKNRDQKAKAFATHKRNAKKVIMQIAKDKFGIPPGQVAEVYTGTITGFTVKNVAKNRGKDFLSKAKASKEVLAVGNDFEMSINLIAENPMSAAESKALTLAQAPSWGTNYTGWTDKTGSPYWAWIVDTGIDLNHPDLNVMTGAYAKSCVSYTTSANDDHNHGSHVAGIIAAKNNGFGTRGVAAGAWVVPVKVCNSGGGCAWSDVLEGLEHISKYSISGDVVNISLGMSPPSWWDNLWNLSPARAEKEIKDLAASGVHMVFSAGNDNRVASKKSPARINCTRCYTVSAHTYGYNIASFSNYGNPPVDWSAPGVGIRSCNRSGGYTYMDGTSMSAPHVAGIILANTNGPINYNRRLNTDKDSSKDKCAIK